MSLLKEPSESTPLRQRQQQQHTIEFQSPSPDHLQTDEFSEYMSINNNNHTIGSDSSRVDITEPNSQQPFNPKPNFIMSDTRRILTRITIDFIILLTGESFINIYFIMNNALGFWGF